MKYVITTAACAVAALVVLVAVAPSTNADTYDLTVDRVKIDTGAFVKDGIGYNGASPGPVLRFKEGEDIVINVTNNLKVTTSIHWHGLILPFTQDGVPTISFDGIRPGQTFTYRFPAVQSGTYWYHSHSGLQEPDGAYGAIIIEPKDREPFRYDRDYVIQFADKHPHSGHRIMRNLKTMPDYYNRMQRTASDFFDDINRKGFAATLSDRSDWGDMRMMPTDIEDVQGFTALINGRGPEHNWTGLFKPGERIRLRFINSSAMTYFDVRIPGLKMTVVEADGNLVMPVVVDELRVAVAETYDVIVRPTEDRAYTIFAESMGRSAYARGTLAPREGMTAEVPEMRERPLLTMADMGMAHEGMDHSAMGHTSTKQSEDAAIETRTPSAPHAEMHSPNSAAEHGAGQGAVQGDTHGRAAHSEPERTGGQGERSPAPQHATGMDHSMHGGDVKRDDPFYAPGSGLTPKAANGGKFLSYSDLKAFKPLYDVRPPDREIEMRITGNMERYIWSLNGIKYGDAEPIRLRYGERVRFKFVNETMMTHPMHLHGMWSILDTGADKRNPVKHVVSVAPGTTVYMETEVDAVGRWAFHCHLAYHAAAGMFRMVVVEGGPRSASIGEQK